MGRGSLMVVKCSVSLYHVLVEVSLAYNLIIWLASELFCFSQREVHEELYKKTDVHSLTQEKERWLIYMSGIELGEIIDLNASAQTTRHKSQTKIILFSLPCASWTSIKLTTRSTGIYNCTGTHTAWSAGSTTHKYMQKNKHGIRDVATGSWRWQLIG